MFLSPNHKSLESDREATDYLYQQVSMRILQDRYLLPNESVDGMYLRVAGAYSDNSDHMQRIYNYMKSFWFLPATPILSNGGTQRGLPISCFLNDVTDNLEGIVDIWNENVWLATSGGGIGTYWGDVRSIGEKVKGCGNTSGIIPFIRVMDSLTLAISQGSLRRGSAAVYIDIHHPEINEFLEIRKPFGDFNRKSLNLHHGILITDKFMQAVESDSSFDLISPKTKKTVQTVNARALWQQVLELRVQTGEPYLVFIDAVNKAFCKYQKEFGMKVKTSNLCSEIMLATGKDHLGKRRTAVCCLSSVNLDRFDQWQHDESFLEDIFRFLDNVLQDFINKASKTDGRMAAAAYSAHRERSVGLGVMGLASYFQKKLIPLESALAKSWNINFFSYLKKRADQISIKLAQEKGSCPDAYDAGVVERFSHKIAIAPTASISLIGGCVSPSIEPYSANIFTQKTLSGSFTIKNVYFANLMKAKYKITNDEIWFDILAHEGSVQHLNMLSQHDKNVFKTAFEVNQNTLVNLAADRVPYICQGQSMNIFLNANVSKRGLLMIHWNAWKKGLKSLYYCRSRSVQTASFASQDYSETSHDRRINNNDYQECEVCQ